VTTAVPIADVSEALCPWCGRALAWSPADIPWWAFGGMMVVAAAGYVVLMRIRRSAVRADDGDPVAADLRQLDDLRRQGLLTDQEFRRGRRAVLAGLTPTEDPSPEDQHDEEGASAADGAADPADGGDPDRPAG